ncbi:MAG: oligosaccharide flippase family protein [Vicinamibacterales bacterium]
MKAADPVSRQALGQSDPTRGAGATCDSKTDELTAADTGTSGPEPLVKEAAMAARNSVTLASAVLASWAVGLVGRLIIPRYLGPQHFGAFQFADYCASSFFVISVLGIDTYIRKEVGRRREHASEFFGGLLLLRLAASAVAMALMFAMLILSHKPVHVMRLVAIFSAYQVFAILNTSFGAMLSSIGAVKGASIANVLTKMLWAGGIVAVALAGWRAEAFALTLVAAEIVKSLLLLRLVRRAVGLRFQIDPVATRDVVISSLPFWVVSITGTLYITADITLMAFRATEIEVGWYGAATSLVNVTMILAPVIHDVFLPMSSLAAARSSEELNTLARRAFEVLIGLVTPIAVFAGLAADFLVYGIFGDRFAPAVMIFRLLCPVLFLVYVSILPALLLTRLDRGWTVTWVSIAVLSLNLALNWFAIPWGSRLLGAGGAGIAAAVVWFVCEAANVATFTVILSDRLFDRRNLTVIGKTAGAAAAVLTVHHVWGSSVLSFAGCAVLYSALVVATGAVRVAELRAVAARRIRYRREGRRSMSEPTKRQTTHAGTMITTR